MEGEIVSRRVNEWLGERTSSSLSFLHSSQPPSQRFFILLTATSRLLAYSGRAPGPHCIADSGVLGGKLPCQSHNHTVPNEPSPTTLRGVYVRVDARRRKKERRSGKEE